MKKFLAIILCFSFVLALTSGVSYAKGDNKAAPPNLTIHVKEKAAVDIVPTTEDKIWADYNELYYKTEINRVGNDWVIEISCIVDYYNDPVQLYLPDIQWGNVEITADYAYLDCRAIKSGTINARFSYGSVNYVQPSGFSGNFTGLYTGGYFCYSSEDNFMDSNVKIVNNGFIVVDVPEIFTKKGKTYTYSNGTKSNQIDITMKGFGYFGIE